MKNLLILVLLAISNIAFSQSKSTIEKAKELGNQWKFEQAIELLQNEIKSDPNNAELYYWLGRYSHYIVYDTRPFANKSDEWSKEEVLKNFKKAITLNPNYGDAKYFIAAEYGARAHEALKLNDTNQYLKELKSAFDWGGFPSFALEHGRNLLKSCDLNSILIVNGDAQYNVIQYLQNIEGYRKDVSLVVYALLERPYYLKLLRDGVPNIIKPIPLKLSDNLIMELHNYKWKDNVINIPTSDTLKPLEWMVEPDVGESKLWSGTAVLINIIETNNWERPVHFSWGGIIPSNGLDDYLQVVGMTAKLVPFKVKGTKYEFDREIFEKLMFDTDNYKDYKEIAINNQPRVGFAFGNFSRLRIVNYTEYLLKNNEYEKAKFILKTMEELMPESVFALNPYMKNQKKELEEKIKAGQ